MMNLFPSRTVSLYMARLFLVRTFAILAGLVLILQTLDLLSESASILAYPGNGQGQVWEYITLRTPEIIAQFLPFSVLLGTIITLTTLNQNSEIVALKSSGMSAHQVLAPLLLASLGVAALSFAFNDRIVTRATATLDVWQHVDYAPIPKSRDERTNVWVRDGENLVRAFEVHGRGAQTQLSQVTVFRRDGGSLTEIISAPTGERQGNLWVLNDAIGFNVASRAMERLGNVSFGPEIRPDQFTLANVNPDGMSFGALHKAIADLERAGRPTENLRGALWHKLSGPLSSVLMPLLGAVAGFGLARSGKLFVRAVIGMALGFAYFVADNFALAMGNIGAYPPFLAAWAPLLLFLLVGEAVLFRTEE